MEKTGVLFVCLGNICRSPMAEGLFTQHVRDAGLEDQFMIDSCGTSDYHVGEAPDRRMTQTAKRNGVNISQLKGRQLKESDFRRFHYVIPMDKSNFSNAEKIIPANSKSKLVLMRDFDPTPGDGQVPDPYWSEQDGFEEVFQILNRSTERLLAHIRKERGI